MKNIKITSFVDDGEKMRDFFDLTKEEFLESYSYLTEEEYDATAEYVKEHNLAKPLWVCNNCLCAIEAHEGRQMHREWDVDPDDERQSKCHKRSVPLRQSFQDLSTKAFPCLR